MFLERLRNPPPAVGFSPQAWTALQEAAIQWAIDRGSRSHGCLLLRRQDSAVARTGSVAAPTRTPSEAPDAADGAFYGKVLLFTKLKDGLYKVGTAFFIPDNGGETRNAASSGSVDCYTNFEQVERVEGTKGAPAPEGAAFGWGKVAIELYNLRLVLTNPKALFPSVLDELIYSRFTKEADKSKYEQIKTNYENAVIEGRDFKAISDACIKQLMLNNLSKLYDGLVARINKNPIRFMNDPVYDIMGKLKSLSALEDPDSLSAVQVYDAYALSRMPFVGILDRTHPELAKFGLGNAALHPFYVNAWERVMGAGLRVWAVFFARVYMLLSNEGAALVYAACNFFGEGCEFSDNDDLWGHLIKTTSKDFGPLCCLLTDDDAATAIYELVVSEGSEPKLLATANDAVTTYLEMYVGRQPIDSRLMDRMRMAETSLRELGWEELKCTGKTYKFFDPPHLSETTKACLRELSKQDARLFIERLHTALPSV